MKYVVLPDGNLKLSVDKEERKELRVLHNDYRATQDWFNEALSRTGLEEVFPEYVGALTSAPMLGIYGPDTPLEAFHKQEYNRIVGHWDGQTWYRPVEYAWAWVEYAVKSLFDELLEKGFAVLQAATDRPWVEIEFRNPGQINHSTIATDPKNFSWTETRNGLADIKAVDVFMDSEHVALQGISAKTGKLLRHGGISFRANTMDELCRQWQEFRQQQQQQQQQQQR